MRDLGAVGGDPVVLLHGFPQDASSYDDVVPHLHAQGLRTLVPTQRGYTATALPDRRRDYRMSELVGDVVALLDAAGLERTHLVGHDWGGALAWAVAGVRPDRVRSLTVLSTPHPAAMTAALLKSSQGLKSWYMAFFQLPLLPELALRQGGQARLARNLSRSGLPPAHVARYCATLTDRGTATGALNWYRGLPWSLRAPLPKVGVPTTYVWGRQDFALGRYAAEHTADHVVGDYRFEALDAGHWLPETRPEEVATAILERTRSAT